ncbi:hypothetical protein EDD21DRAFT_371987 [Dissophora ornata]|nr:hypothetical protein EDD21DRAFT_371987 [Dissophora ornata]
MVYLCLYFCTQFCFSFFLAVFIITNIRHLYYTLQRDFATSRFVYPLLTIDALAIGKLGQLVSCLAVGWKQRVEFYTVPSPHKHAFSLTLQGGCNLVQTVLLFLLSNCLDYL